ncbi:MAG: hypothetical protein ACFB0B_11630 [Thermonemataceae bacterium]
MRIIKELTHPSCKITIFAWNQKYLIKYERNGFEQTYKISEMDVTGEQEVEESALSEDFIQDVLKRFKAMQKEWQQLFI